ncbi:hypothetical protein CFOL_v3_20888 [Cephalotus follicularis]|uniref:Transmembrane protein n=1 Tax=Cephalotus follicularis TaxID=3775 RepID=A0A1Q3CB10_CEPFO|nr:hypothetical protein CFOL_v3_20888 [Cephalotus follicularis]
MSSQPQQQVMVYPNTVTGQPPPAASHSNGSFGTVFIVLAVIVVISAIACCLGRMCTRRFRQEKLPKQKQSSRPKDREKRDLEFGFDDRIPTGKPAGNGEPRGFKVAENGDFMRGEARGIFRVPESGDIRGEAKPDYDGELRASA